MINKLSLFFILFCVSTDMVAAAWLTPIEQNTAIVGDGQYGYKWEDRDVVGLSAANAIVIDSAGAVFTAGYRYDGSTVPADIVVTKRDNRGSILWESVVDCPGMTATVNCDDRAVAMAIDSSNDLIYVLAASNRGQGTDQDLVVIKYNSGSSAPAWISERYDNGNSLDTPAAITLAPGGGDILIIGSSQNAGHSSSLPDRDVVTASLAANDGLINWSQRFEYQAGGDDQAISLGVDASGNVVVLANATGVNLSGLDSINRVAVVKYDANGIEQWQFVNGDQTKFNSFSAHTSNATAYALALDAAGNSYITGSIVGQNGRDVLLIALNGTNGTVLADESPLQVPGYSGYDLGSAIKVTSDSVYVGALTGGVADYDLVVLKFDPGLNLLLISNAINVGLDDGPGPGWSSSAINTPGPAFLDIDAQGHLFVGASVGNFGSHDIGLYVYDASLTLLDSTIKSTAGDILLRDAVIGTDINGQSLVYTVGHSLLTSTGDDEAVVTAFSIMHPDLTAANLTAPAQWPIGAPIAIQSDIINLNEGLSGSLSNAAGFTVQYVLDNGAGGQIILGSQTIASLASGATVLDTFNYDSSALVPADVGIYTLQVNIDSQSGIVEQDETNNTIGIPVEVINPPDLTITAGSGSTPVTAGAIITITYTVANLRNVDAGTFDVTFALFNIATSNIVSLTGVDTITSLTGGTQIANRQFDANVPQSLSDGNYQLIVTADPVVNPGATPNGQVLESNESNNSFTNTTVPITVLPIPDLKVTNVAAGLGYATGTTYPLDVTLWNDAPAGADISPNFTTGIYMSTDSLVSTADVRIGQAVSAAPLVAGNTVTLTANINLPTGTAVGQYYIGAIADDTIPEVVTESNETNNSGAASIISVVGSAADGRPDLTVTGMSSSLAGNGITFDVKFSVRPTVENILPFVVPQPFSIGVYLSLDSQITTADLRLGGEVINDNTASTWVNSPQILGLTVTQSSSQNITWTNLINAAVGANNELIASALLGTGGGATSAEVINGDGGIRMTVAETNTSRYFGLTTSANAANVGPGVIEYGFYLRGGNPADVIVVESGSGKTTGLVITTGDELSVQRAGTTITYLKNGVVFYTSNASSSGGLVADVAFVRNFSENATIANGILFSTIAPGSYYIGAIADDGAQINEVVESNNNALLTGGSQVTVSAVMSAGNSGSGGGLTSLLELMVLCAALLSGIFFHQLRQFSPQSNRY